MPLNVGETMETIVEVALDSLSRRVNIGISKGTRGIAGQREKHATIELFKILKANNVPFYPDEVAGWLVTQLNWKPKDADDVRKIASEILSGKRKKSNPSWADNIFETWKEKAKKR